MAGWGWFIVCVIAIVVAVCFGFIYLRRHQAIQRGLPPPSLNPFARREREGTRIYPAPTGVIGWTKDKLRAIGIFDSSRSGGSYVPTTRSGRRRQQRGLDPDEAWDTNVGAEADAYGSGGYYEEQELGLNPDPGHSGVSYAQNDRSGEGYGEDGSLPAYGHEDMRRGRGATRDSTKGFIGGSQQGLDERYDQEFNNQQNSTSSAPTKDHVPSATHPSDSSDPFGDHAEARSLRDVSPRPVAPQ